MIKLLLFILASIVGITPYVKNSKLCVLDKSPLRQQKIISELLVDVTGDEKEETVILCGTSVSENGFYENVKITVSDSLSGNTLFSVMPITNFGYSPNILAEDFTGDGVKEIFYSADSGGSGGFGYFYLYDFSGQRTKTLFDYETVVSPFKAKYEDWYKVKVFGDEKEIVIDVSCKPKEILNELYKDGKAVSDKQPEISGVNYVFAYFNESEKVFSLVVVRRITGLYSADLIGYLTQNYTFIDGHNNSGDFAVVII